MVQAQDGVQCGLGHPSPSRPPGGLCGNPSAGTTSPSPAPGAGRARRFPRVSSLPEAAGRPWLSPSLLRGKGPTFVSRAGAGNRGGPERPPLLPTYVPHVGAQADKLQNSLELRKTGPAVGCAPSLSAAPGPWLGAPGRVRRRRPHAGRVQAAAVSEREQV